ncbi:cutinase family protein [Mycolicibacterium fluoranthenivorans]|uniref:Cutinase n=1 Tax=Mycolicibacterium fluoranthenivorans TaxID=258505 RepID=A0A7X5ZBX7_9MYCO|nr:cutinase family protein [Mycolicibacterium fluoranthenivorans]MCV7359207.1 cutinase family protein [Mycolicibacterium fluoranthenivorans]NIH94557.1 cutinase [Mycolicibacterium fluoranthenivorans]
MKLTTGSTLLAAGLSLAAVLGPQATAAAAPACPDVEVVFARGTFEAPGVGATGQAFVDALNSRLPGEAVAVDAVNYPASLDFEQAAQGVADASNTLESLAAGCPNTKIVLGGYSQGAAVAGYTTADSVPAGFVLPAGISGPMPASVASHVAAVVLFGTPSPLFLGLADHDAPPIAIGDRYQAKTLELCAPGDPVCSPGISLDRAAHSAYKDNGMALQAADFVVRQLGQPAPSVPSAQQAT